MIESLRRLFLLLNKKEKRQIWILLALMVIGAFVELAGIGAIPAFISLIADPEKLHRIPVLSRFFTHAALPAQRELMIFGSLALIVLFVLKNLYITFLFHFRLRLVFNTKKRLENSLFEMYMNAPYTFHLQKNSASLIRNITQEITVLIVNILLPLLTAVMDSILLLFILTLLIIANPVITIGSVFVLGISSFYFFKLVRKKLKEYGAEALHQRMLMIKIINHGLGGLKEVRLFNRERFFLEEFEESTGRMADSSRYRQLIGALPKPFLETLAVFGMLAITLVFFAQGQKIETLIPMLALFAISMVRLLPAFNELIVNFASMRYSLSSVHPVYQEFQELADSSVSDRGAGRSEPLDFKERLDLQDISFHYPNSAAEVLNQVSLTIRRGETVGFVGETGTGKTTLIDIILRILKETNGRITVDGRDVGENNGAWQRKIGYVPQFIFLMDESIRSNICFGLKREETSEENLKYAVRAAQLGEFISTLPEGLDTVIGERGIRLSGGQRQRIGIARALYNRPEVLVLDEATSSLDNLTEKEIMDFIGALRGQLTILIVAHRLTTIQHCDRIFYMREGRIVDSGNFAELKKKNEHFRRLALGGKEDDGE